MKIKYRHIINSFVFCMMVFMMLIGNKLNASSISKIVSKLEITSALGLSIVRDESQSNGGTVYKLINIPSNINILDIKLINKSISYTFSNDGRILLDSSGVPVSNLNDDTYTIILNTKELGQVYKVVNKTDYGYRVLDIKVTYNDSKNVLEVQDTTNSLSGSEVSVFRNDSKIGNSKLDGEGKASIQVNDINDLTTSTYTVLLKKGSEIVGIDSFHINPIYREISVKDNVKLSIISQVSNKLNVCIDKNSGIGINDNVYVVSVYDESNPSENMLLNLDYTQNQIKNLQGEIILKTTLCQGKKYKARLRVNGIDLDQYDACDVNIRDIDASKIKATAIEKIGKDLRVDLSGINNLSKDDVIEVVSLHDIKDKEKNLISPCKLTNKVNTIDILGRIEAGNAYELILKINGFVMNGFGVEVIPVDLSNASALTDVISNKIFISLDHAKGLKITDIVKVIGVFRDGGDAKNLLKSNYNTTIERLNGSIFINQTLDTKNNYFVRFKINDIELDNVLKVTVNNNISFKGAIAKSKNTSHEVEVCFKNIDCISNHDLIEIDSVFNLDDINFNLIDKDKGTKLNSKKGIIKLKGAIVSEYKYGIKVKINGVKFDEIIPILVEENNDIKFVTGHFTNENNLVLDSKHLNIDGNIDIVGIKNKLTGNQLLNKPILNIVKNENGEIIISDQIAFEPNNSYFIYLNYYLKDGTRESLVLEFNNIKENENKDNQYDIAEKIINKEEIKDDEEEGSFVDINSIEFGDGNIKFKHNIDDSFKINQVLCAISKLEVKVEGDHILINKLVPLKTYKDLKIELKNDKDECVKINLPEFKCKKSEDDIKNFISYSYINIKNGVDKNENSIEFPSEDEFWLWYNKLKNEEVDLRNFIFTIIKDEEFDKKYIDNPERIKIIYNIVFGNSPSDQSLNLWLSDFNKILKTEDMSKSIRIIIEKMFTNVKFKSLEKQLKGEVKEK